LKHLSSFKQKSNEITLVMVSENVKKSLYFIFFVAVKLHSIKKENSFSR